MEKVKCLILGGGPAGFTAAIYASRANLSPVLYEGIQPGGQLTTTTIVENFPGFPGGVDANTLMDSMREQARGFGADIRQGTATAVDLGNRPFKVVIDGETDLEAETLIIATGAQARYLGLPSSSPLPLPTTFPLPWSPVTPAWILRTKSLPASTPPTSRARRTSSLL